MSDPKTIIPEDWWDGRQAGSFFPHVYYEGDKSREGYLNMVPLAQVARTARECELLETELRENFPESQASELKILDCPCGQGRHSIYLARLGYTVVGADLCPDAIAAAREALAKEPDHVQRRCSFVEDDMRSLRKVGSGFSAAINMFFSFGFFSEEGNLATLRSYHSVLATHGILLIHTDVNRYLIDDGGYGDPTHRTTEDGSQLLVEEHWDASSGRLNGGWTITRPSGEQRSGLYSVRIYSSSELKRHFQSCGFDPLAEKPVAIFGRKFSVHKSQEIIYLAVKE
jgi:SAM-dependent methyltransferase